MTVRVGWWEICMLDYKTHRETLRSNQNLLYTAQQRLLLLSATWAMSLTGNPRSPLAPCKNKLVRGSFSWIMLICYLPSVREVHVIVASYLKTLDHLPETEFGQRYFWTIFEACIVRRNVYGTIQELVHCVCRTIDHCTRNATSDLRLNVYMASGT